MARYKLDPNDTWHTEVEYPSSRVLVETRDLIDTRSGHVYRQGAYRVSMPGVRPVIFKGESAWSDAGRLAENWAATARMKGH